MKFRDSNEELPLPPTKTIKTKRNKHLGKGVCRATLTLFLVKRVTLFHPVTFDRPGKVHKNSSPALMNHMNESQLNKRISINNNIKSWFSWIVPFKSEMRTHAWFTNPHFDRMSKLNPLQVEFQINRNVLLLWIGESILINRRSSIITIIIIILKTIVNPSWIKTQRSPVCTTKRLAGFTVELGCYLWSLRTKSRPVKD